MFETLVRRTVHIFLGLLNDRNTSAKAPVTTTIPKNRSPIKYMLAVTLVKIELLPASIWVVASVAPTRVFSFAQAPVNTAYDNNTKKIVRLLNSC